MCSAVQEGCIASCVWYFLLPDPTHTLCLLRSTPISVSFLLLVNTVHRRFRHLHVVHGLSYPLSRRLLRLPITLFGGVCNLLSHSLHSMILGDNSVLCKKQFLDFILLSAGCFPYKEWTSFVSCLVFSILAHTSLRMSGGAIQASKYRSSTLVVFRHPVTALHALFS